MSREFTRKRRHEKADARLSPRAKGHLQHRRHERIEPPSEATIIIGGLSGTILDLSEGGAKVQHTGLLRPGAEVDAFISYKDFRLQVRVSVVWSNLVETTKEAEGNTVLLYESGLEFKGIAEKGQHQIANLLKLLKG